MTRVQLSSGAVIRTEASLEKVCGALETALAESRLLELRSQEGESIVLNPVQIQALQDESAEVEEPVPAGRTQVPA